MPPKGTKKSLQEMLAEHGSKRNDWNSGRPGGAATRIGPDGFPEYDPSAFQSESDEDDGKFGGAFAALSGLGGLDDGEDEFVEVVSKKNKKKPGPAAGPPGAGAGPSSSRAPAPAARGPSAGAGPSSSRAAGLPVPRPSAALVMPRAPYNVGAAEAAPPPRAPRPRTHDNEGRPLTDTYYQTFQKVYRNAGGDVCMRFHKTDIVIAKPSGEVVVTSGGYKTKTTFQSLSEGLEPMGINLRSSRGEGYGDWWVELPDGGRQDWEDHMTIPASNAEDRTRGQRLLAAFHGTSAAAGATTGAAGRAAVGPAGAPYRPVGSGAGAAAGPYSGGAGAAGSYGAYPGAGAPGTAARPGQPGAGSAAAVRDPSVPAAAGAGGGDAESLHALISSALLLQDEALIAGTSQAHAEHLLDDEHCCIACMAALKTTVLIPCGHMVLCSECAADVVSRTGVCPMCRERVDTTVTVQ